MLTFWKRTERLVPCVVRLLARKRYGRPLTLEEISEASGLAPGHVQMISQQTDWSGVDLPTTKKFLKGCQCNFENLEQMKRVDAYLRSRPNWEYLRISKEWHSVFQPLMVRWMEAKQLKQ